MKILLFLFKVMGGTVIADVNVEEGSVIQIPNMPTKDGYEFSGWYSDSELISTFNFSDAIEGDFAISNPEIEFILTRIDGVWIFGILTPNQNQWKERRNKPYNYSHALDIRIAKAVLNIGINNNKRVTIIDPCCGIGTVIIEGRFQGLNIEGYEMNPLVKQQCNKNLIFYGFDPSVLKQDFLQTTKHFNLAILDLPYGQSSIISPKEQKALIQKTKEISDKSVIITMEDMRETMIEVGLEVLDFCVIKKSNVFSRFITLCS